MPRPPGPSCAAGRRAARASGPARRRARAPRPSAAGSRRGSGRARGPCAVCAPPRWPTDRPASGGRGGCRGFAPPMRVGLPQALRSNSILRGAAPHAALWPRLTEPYNSRSERTLPRSVPGRSAVATRPSSARRPRAPPRGRPRGPPRAPPPSVSPASAAGRSGRSRPNRGRSATPSRSCASCVAPWSASRRWTSGCRLCRVPHCAGWRTG